MATFLAPNSMVNKQLYVYFFALSAFCFSCKESSEEKNAAETATTETVICELIKTRVLLEDTTFKFQAIKDTVWTSYRTHKDSMRVKAFPSDMSQLSLWEYEDYWHSFYNIFQNDKIIFTDTSLNIRPDYKSRTEIYKMCDSIMFLDEPNKPTRWICDSTSTIATIKIIDFYEKWYQNKTDGSIRKDVLAYRLLNNNNKYEKFVPVFYIFKNKKIYEQLKSKIQRKK